MMLLKTPRILYFIKGSVPTVEQQREAARYGSNVAFRNCLFVPNEGAPEACDGVAGDVPALYAKLPAGADVIRDHLANTNMLIQPAPKVESDAKVGEETKVPAAPSAAVIHPTTPLAAPAPVGSARSTGVQENATIIK